MPVSVLFESWWEFDSTCGRGYIFSQASISKIDNCSGQFYSVYFINRVCSGGQVFLWCWFLHCICAILYRDLGSNLVCTVCVCLFLPPTVRNLQERAQKNSPTVNLLSLTTASWSWKLHSKISLSLPPGACVPWAASDGSTAPCLFSFTGRGSAVKTLSLEHIHFSSLIWPWFCSDDLHPSATELSQQWHHSEQFYCLIL